jgi:two-component system chemotaxis response regulator CheB
MSTQNIVIIGASGGGPHILSRIFTGMPRLDGAIVVVQHMPAYINQAFSANLASVTPMTVKLAENGERLENGRLYVAPSELHLRLVQNEKIELAPGDKVNFVCPSIDVAMLSLTKDPGIRLYGIILSGIGTDGAKGIRHIKQLGGTTIAIEKDPNTITGMANEAVATGQVDWVLDPEQIRNKLMAMIGWKTDETVLSRRFPK